MKICTKENKVSIFAHVITLFKQSELRGNYYEIYRSPLI